MLPAIALLLFAPPAQQLDVKPIDLPPLLAKIKPSYVQADRQTVVRGLRPIVFTYKTDMMPNDVEKALLASGWTSETPGVTRQIKGIRQRVRMESIYDSGSTKWMGSYVSLTEEPLLLGLLPKEWPKEAIVKEWGAKTSRVPIPEMLHGKLVRSHVLNFRDAPRHSQGYLVQGKVEEVLASLRPALMKLGWTPAPTAKPLDMQFGWTLDPTPEKPAGRDTMSLYLMPADEAPGHVMVTVGYRGGFR